MLPLSTVLNTFKNLSSDKKEKVLEDLPSSDLPAEYKQAIYDLVSNNSQLEYQLETEDIVNELMENINV